MSPPINDPNKTVGNDGISTSSGVGSSGISRGSFAAAGPTNGLLQNDGTSYFLLNTGDYILLNG